MFISKTEDIKNDKSKLEKFLYNEIYKNYSYDFLNINEIVKKYTKKSIILENIIKEIFETNGGKIFILMTKNNEFITNFKINFSNKNDNILQKINEVKKRNLFIDGITYFIEGKNGKKYFNFYNLKSIFGIDEYTHFLNLLLNTKISGITIKKNNEGIEKYTIKGKISKEDIFDILLNNIKTNKINKKLVLKNIFDKLAFFIDNPAFLIKKYIFEKENFFGDEKINTILLRLYSALIIFEEIKENPENLENIENKIFYKILENVYRNTNKIDILGIILKYIEKLGNIDVEEIKELINFSEDEIKEIRNEIIKRNINIFYDKKYKYRKPDIFLLLYVIIESFNKKAINLKTINFIKKELEKSKNKIFVNFNISTKTNVYITRNKEKILY